MKVYVKPEVEVVEFFVEEEITESVGTNGGTGSDPYGWDDDF